MKGIGEKFRLKLSSSALVSGSLGCLYLVFFGSLRALLAYWFCAACCAWALACASARPPRLTASMNRRILGLRLSSGRIVKPLGDLPRLEGEVEGAVEGVEGVLFISIHRHKSTREELARTSSHTPKACRGDA